IVLFPEPLCPTIATKSPRSIVRSTLRSARTTTASVAYSFVTPWSWMIGSEVIFSFPVESEPVLLCGVATIGSVGGGAPSLKHPAAVALRLRGLVRLVGDDLHVAEVGFQHRVHAVGDADVDHARLDL